MAKVAKGYPNRIDRSKAKHYKGTRNTDKIGSERNPIEYIEDDVFCYTVSLNIPNELC
jgi:hypothetical protein